MDPGEIVPLRLKMSEIREIAEVFRKEHIFTSDIPVEIEHIIEATMGISIIPVSGLNADCDMDGFISKDLKFIYVDKLHYESDKYYNRVRFTIAHEIGHLNLHRSIIDGLEIDSMSDWISFRQGIQNGSLSWFETQASEFAGRLLVPLEPLVEYFKEAREEILRMNSSWDSPKLEISDIYAYAAGKIAHKFAVSEEVLERRLNKEDIQSFLGLHS